MKFQDLDFFRAEPLREIDAYNLETLAYTAAQSFARQPRLLAIVTPTLYDTQQLHSMLSDFLDPESISLFVYDEVLRVDALGSSHEMMFERLRALRNIYLNRPNIIIFNAVSLLRPTLSREQFLASYRLLRVGESFDRAAFIASLAESGYVRRNRVEHPGEFAVRGMIYDFFDPASYQPVRLEIDGHRIEEIRRFDPSLEISTESLNEAEIGPAYDLLYQSEDSEKIVKDLHKAADKLTEFDSLRARVGQLVENVRSGGDGRLVPYRHFAYFGRFGSVECPDILACRPEEIKAALERALVEDRGYFAELSGGRMALARDSLYLNRDPASAVSLMRPLRQEEAGHLTGVPYVFESLLTLSSNLNSIRENGYCIYLFLPAERRSSLIARLTDDSIPFTCYPETSPITLVDGDLAVGFMDPDAKRCFLGTKEIFGLKNRRANFLTRYKEARIIRRFDDLEVGDYVVHELHGIGRYDGVKMIDGLEYLKVLYRDDDRLYIPISQFKLIRKYSGREGFKPTLDKLGGSTWSRRKAQVRGKISYLADQLLAISSRRKAERGTAFPAEPEMEREFSDAFAYDLTSSQRRAWAAIATDMESERPMDRLLAGDVGFGKTELAFRAAYRAILAGKQVALLCPTTVLCRQHYEVAVHRFRGFGVRIGCFSRFISTREQAENIEKLKKGRLDLVIGTHRLLSEDIVFAGLGLLIIDEEQRFGVAQKEKIKMISGNIDVLTLTATPIPRTLQMSLLGVRELSNLDEPPLNRLPIKTYVTTYDDGLIKEAISIELGRKGQVYFLHNRVNTIYAKAKKLQQLFPNARIGVAHGSLDPESMADVMNSFYDGEIDVLVCTTIIETGLDVPNVNTIIIEDADRFGLSQLYQIKGRVGRSDRLAYAYFFYDPHKEITDESRKRLKALKDFTELGSGYNIAKQDLNLRGAGNILGAEQAGFMDTLGYDSYTALLDEVIAQKKLVTEAVKQPATSYELSFSLDSHVPESYAEEASRITIYRELSQIRHEEELESFTKKLRDVYGPFPQEVYNLLVKKSIELKLSKPYTKSFIEAMDHYELALTREVSSKRSIASRLQDQLSPVQDIMRVYFKNGSFYLRINKTRDYLEQLLYICNTINQLADEM